MEPGDREVDSGSYLEQGNEDIGSNLDSLRVFSCAVLIIGGTLMFIGSCEPWTYSGLYNGGLVVHRNGLQLGNNNTFSPAAIPAIVAGSVALLEGALLLAERRVPRVLRLPWTLLGLIGVATGLYGLGEARWYTKQLISRYGAIFFGGASYGTWLVLSGGIGVLLVGLLQLRMPLRFSSAIATLTGIAAVSGGLFLAPRL
jgi:hypothetical protein